MPAAHVNKLFLSTAAAIYVAVFVAFLLLEHAGLGIGALLLPRDRPGRARTRAGLGRGSRCARDRALHVGVLLNHAPAVERDLHDLDADPARQLRRDRERCSAGSRRTTARRTPSCRFSRSATSSPGCRTRGHSSSRSTGASQPGKPFALLVGDLDSRRFDDDRDEALRRVSDALSSRLGPEADVARVGGEEFAVLTPCESVEQAAQLAVAARAEPLRERLARHVRLVGVPARGRERADALPRRRRAALRAPRATRAPGQPRPHSGIAGRRARPSSNFTRRVA